MYDSDPGQHPPANGIIDDKPAIVNKLYCGMLSAGVLRTMQDHSHAERHINLNALLTTGSILPTVHELRRHEGLSEQVLHSRRCRMLCNCRKSMLLKSSIVAQQTAHDDTRAAAMLCARSHSSFKTSAEPQDSSLTLMSLHHPLEKILTEGEVSVHRREGIGDTLSPV